ncbi:MAG: hypothetical protein V4581_16585 [Bacteroidota bacterium]
MKKLILALSLLAVLSSTVVSCSTDDSALEQTNVSADGGDNQLVPPRPTKP